MANKVAFLIRLNYGPKIFGYLAIFLVVLSITFEQGSSPDLVGIMIYCLALPHLAYWFNTRYFNTNKAEFRTMILDSFFGGFLIAWLSFLLLPTVFFVTSMCVNNIVAGGKRLFFKGGLWLVLGMSASIMVNGFEFLPETDLRTSLLSALFLLIYVVLIGFLSHDQAMIAKSAKNKVEQAKQVIEGQNQAILATQQQLVQAEKMVSLGALTAGVAHEINNPINVVHVGVQNMTNDLISFEKLIFELAGDDAEEAILDSFRQQLKPMYEHLRTINKGTGRIKTIVDDLRTYTQLDAAQQKTVCITDCLNSTINLVKTKYLDVAQFSIDFDSEPTLLCYPAQLNQVFMNLIVNACDAIEAKQRQQNSQDIGTIMIGCDKADDVVTMTFRDSGCGMSEKTISKLFEPFFTTKEVGKGTGLGLSIAYGTIQRHNGQLTVESTLGVGSVFTLMLPVGE